MVHFTADQHFYHVGAYQFPARMYRSLDDMHRDLIDRWNYVVADDDTVYVLGDFVFGNDYKNLRDITRALRGKKYFIKGNHDQFHPNAYINCGFTWYYDHPILVFNDLLLSHEPVLGITGDGLFNIHGHTHGKAFALQTYKHIDVSADAVQLRPVSYNEIMRSKAALEVT